LLSVIVLALSNLFAIQICLLYSCLNLVSSSFMMQYMTLMHELKAAFPTASDEVVKQCVLKVG
jgi:hypothetical protein